MAKARGRQVVDSLARLKNQRVRMSGFFRLIPITSLLAWSSSSMTDSREQQLDSYNPAERREALLALCQQVEAGRITLPTPGTEVNLHAHTFFSYNAYGYSPSKYAWLALKAG